jgi:cysteine desulfurase/selenocysteine lyase
MLDNIKKDFEIFKKETQKDLVYLDNSATTQVPNNVIKAINEYYLNFKANSHSETYKLGVEAGNKFEEARNIVADFLGAEQNEIIFTSGATQGLNMLAQMLGTNLQKGDNVVLSIMEHHSNFLPWQQMSKKYGFEIRLMELDDNLELDLKLAKKLIDKNTKVVSFVHISNSIGVISPAKEIIKIAKEVDAFTILDAAQSVPHMEIDVKDLDCDFLVFSGHKIGGPTGVGVMYGKSDLLEKMNPVFFGGGMVSQVSLEDAKWTISPNKFEAGSTNDAGVIGLGAAIKYIKSIGFENIKNHEKELLNYAISELQKIEQVKLFCAGDEAKRSSVLSFIVEGIHPHDVAGILDSKGVAVRAGHHCTIPLMTYFKISGTVRASFWVYNSKKDVDRLILGIKEAINTFKV